MKSGKILVYGLEKDKLDWFIKKQEEFQFKIRSVEKHESSYKISELLESDCLEKRNIEHNIDNEILLFAGFTKEDVNHLLDSYRESGLKKINLKAILTQSNKDWSLFDLYKDLKEEYKYMLEYFKNQKAGNR